MFKASRPHLDQVCSIINFIKISSFSHGTQKLIKASLHSDVSCSSNVVHIKYQQVLQCEKLNHLTSV